MSESMEVEVFRQPPLLRFRLDEVARVRIRIRPQLLRRRREAVHRVEVPYVGCRALNLDCGVMEALAVCGDEQVPALAEARQRRAARDGCGPTEPGDEQECGSSQDGD